MATSNSGPISAEARAALGEAIRLVVARWTALQLVVENQWGGRDSRAMANQFGESILSWFCRSKGPHFFEDLVHLMEDTILECFEVDLDLDHDSVQDVADHLLFIHEECLQGNYSPIEKLKNSHVQGNDVSQSRQILADDSISNDDDTSMMNDEAAAAEEMAVDSNRAPDADGWTVVRRRCRRAN